MADSRNRNILNDEIDPFDDVPVRTMEQVARSTVGREVPPPRGMQPATPKGLAVRREQSIIDPNGRMALGRFALTAVGVVIPDDVSKEEWQHARDAMIHWDNAVQWWLGDMLAHGERVYSEGYKLIAAQTGKDVKTLRNYVYVAKSVPMSLRRDKLSFGHHMLVAAMEPDDQHAWLDYAERMQLSVSELRKAINGEPAKKPPTVMPPELKQHIVFLASLNGVPLDRAAKEELREHIYAVRAWLDALEGELD